ncbi:hypothetical protein BG004_001634, partial [Podila humilis]
AKALKHHVVGIHEYFASSKCLRQGCHTFLASAEKIGIENSETIRLFAWNICDLKHVQWFVP